MAVLKRGTFLFVSGTFHEPEKKHLHIVITNPCKENNQLIVPISTWKNSLNDDTCFIDPFEHEFVKVRSFVNYQFAKILPSTSLINGIKSGELEMRDDINPNSFLRIRNGFAKSIRVKSKILKYYQANSGN